MRTQIGVKSGRKKSKSIYKGNGIKKKKQIDLHAMSVDDFMQSGFDGSDESEDYSDVDKPGNKTAVKKYCDGENSETAEAGSKVNSTIVEAENEDLQDTEDSEGDSEVEKIIHSQKIKEVCDDDGDWTSANFSHKKALAKLRNTDPEFYKFLQENDKDILNFDESDSDAEGDEEAGGKIHKAPEVLEVASDESDYEEKGVAKDTRTITLKKVKEWETQLENTSVKSCETIIEVMHAFHAAVVRISNDDDASAKYVVTGSAVFNSVIQLCVLGLQPALKRYLRIPKGKHVDPTKNKVQWGKVHKSVRSYMRNLVKLLSGVSSSHILAVILKHLHQMMPFAACFIVLHHPLLKMLVNLWSTSEDTVRVVAFLCILRLTTHQQNKILDKVLKMMYLAFIRNCKFVSPNSLPGINFMRRSLVEILALDVNVSYRHAFLYIRQLAIHLRNAITLQKKEHVLAVYNWQFVNSLHLWTDLLGVTVNKSQKNLQSLLYPLVQVILGTIKLCPVQQYLPLRFHCTQILIELSKRTCTFIPVLPFLLEILNKFNFNKPHQKVSMKPMTFSCIIRASKVQMQENGFKDVVIDTIYQQMLEYLSSESNSISFPDLILPAAVQIKTFLKSCKRINYNRKMKQLLDKILENAQIVEKEREKVNFKLSDHKSIAAWETQLKLKGTPLQAYYDSWSKVHAQQQAKKITQNDEIGNFNLPILKKRSKEVKPKSDEPVVLFPCDDSDSDVNFLKSEDEANEPVKKRGKRGSGGGKTKKLGRPVLINNEKDDLDNGDIVEDLRLEDLE